jgi:hypothetical protein
MATEFKNKMREVMQMMWQFIRKNGYSRSEALKKAWLNIKLKAAMRQKIVKFYYQKVDGSIREAFGTLKESLLPMTQGTEKKANSTLFTYFDSERESWRSFKRANSYLFADQRILRI